MDAKIMDEIEELPTQKKQPLELYSARVTFRKTRQGARVVSVQIRYTKKGHSRNEKLEFPEYIKDEDLFWTGYHGERIAVYHRKDEYKYVNMQNIIVPAEFGHKLERLVSEFCFKRTPKDRKDKKINAA